MNADTAPEILKPPLYNINSAPENSLLFGSHLQKTHPLTQKRRNAATYRQGSHCDRRRLMVLCVSVYSVVFRTIQEDKKKSLKKIEISDRINRIDRIRTNPADPVNPVHPVKKRPVSNIEIRL